MVISMTDSLQNNTELTEQDVLRIERMRTPSSERLQSNILKLTQELPQYTDSVEGAKVYSLTSFLDKSGVKKIKFWNGFKPYATTIAAGFAIMALSSSLWLPSQNEQLVVDDLATLSVEQLAEEIQWQDLMLLQDELAFAGL